VWQLAAPAQSAAEEPQLARSSGPVRLLTVATCGFLASGILPNESSYAIAMALVVLCLRPRFQRPTRFRAVVLIITGVLIAFGTLKGYGEGHPFNFILRFALPLTTFFFFVSMPGLGLLIVRSMQPLVIATFALTLQFFYVVKTSNWLRADDWMAGWTLTYSSNAGISIWHYFVLPVCALAILGGLVRRWNLVSLTNAIIAGLTLTMLILLNDTSSFVLAILFVVLIFILPRRIARLAVIPVLSVLVLYMLDFITVKILSRWVIDLIEQAGVEDVGDMLRMIQIEYFVDRAEFLGSGFGAQHDFPFMISVARQQAQIEFPYASELPILNIIFNGGIFAVLWFTAILWSFLRLLVVRFEKNSIESDYRLYGLACAGVLVGSISNPFLFAPSSMLLLAIMVDLTDYLNRREAASSLAGGNVRAFLDTPGAGGSMQPQPAGTGAGRADEQLA
jgi:hypothetical protein